MKFKAEIFIVGVNPFVFLPENILRDIFKQVGRDKGPIPVCGTIDNHPFIQTLVKYQGEWRLYVNTPMIKASQKKVGDFAEFEIFFDDKPRFPEMDPEFKEALDKNLKASENYNKLTASSQKEILRYFNSLKSEEARTRNLEKVIKMLSGVSGRYMARDWKEGK